MSSLQKQQISKLVEMLMNEVPNFATNQPSNLPNVNTVSAQPMQPSTECRWPYPAEPREHLDPNAPSTH